MLDDAAPQQRLRDAMGSAVSDRRAAVNAIRETLGMAIKVLDNIKARTKSFTIMQSGSWYQIGDLIASKLLSVIDQIAESQTSMPHVLMKTVEKEILDFKQSASNALDLLNGNILELNTQSMESCGRVEANYYAPQIPFSQKFTVAIYLRSWTWEILNDKATGTHALCLGELLAMHFLIVMECMQKFEDALSWIRLEAMLQEQIISLKREGSQCSEEIMHLRAEAHRHSVEASHLKAEAQHHSEKTKDLQEKLQQRSEELARLQAELQQRPEEVQPSRPFSAPPSGSNQDQHPHNQVHPASGFAPPEWDIYRISVTLKNMGSRVIVYRYWQESLRDSGKGIVRPGQIESEPKSFALYTPYTVELKTHRTPVQFSHTFEGEGDWDLNKFIQ